MGWSRRVSSFAGVLLSSLLLIICTRQCFFRTTTFSSTERHATPNLDRQIESFPSRIVEHESSSIGDNDSTRDEACYKYLFNFLNGTTDARDECQGFFNAWKAADCQEEEEDTKNMIFTDPMDELDFAWWWFMDRVFGIQPPSSSVIQRRHKTKNGTVVDDDDDDIIIDDYLESFQCCRSIADFYEKHCQGQQQQRASLGSFNLLVVVLVLVTCGIIKSVLKMAPRMRWIPDAAACIVVGSIVGFTLRIVDNKLVRQTVLTFNSDLFMQVMLPPIVFEAALSIDKRSFRRDLFPILTLAIFGTGFSALGIGILTYKLSAWGAPPHLPLLDSLLFGSLMSSIDPVATLSILSSVGVTQGDTLYTLIFGESLLNDGVAIVLFDSLIKHFGDADVVGVATVHDTLREFIWVTLGSFVVGISCGFVCTFYFYGLQGKQSAVSEVAMFFLWSLIPYYIADGSGFSGIISIMVMGFMMDYFVVGGFQSEEGEWMEYMAMRHDDGPPVEPHLQRFRAACSRAFSGRGHISSRSRHHVGFVAEVIANLMETSIFAYLGLFLFNDTSFSFKLGMSALFSCISSRAAMVIIVSLLINFCVWIDLEGMLGRLWFLVRRQNSLNLDDDSLLNSERVYIDKKTQLILFSAGIRGAVSYALVQNIPVYDAVTKHGSHFKGELRAMTSSTIVVLLFSLGALTFFTVQQGIEEPERERTSGMLTHRLMGSELDSNIDPMDDLGSLALDEVDSQPLNPRPPTRT